MKIGGATERFMCLIFFYLEHLNHKRPLEFKFIGHVWQALERKAENCSYKEKSMTWSKRNIIYVFLTLCMASDIFSEAKNNIHQFVHTESIELVWEQKKQ